MSLTFSKIRGNEFHQILGLILAQQVLILGMYFLGNILCGGILTLKCFMSMCVYNNFIFMLKVSFFFLVCTHPIIAFLKKLFLLSNFQLICSWPVFVFKLCNIQGSICFYQIVVLPQKPVSFTFGESVFSSVHDVVTLELHLLD